MNPAGRDGESLKLWESAKPKLEEAGFQTEVHLTERVGHASEISFSLKDREDIDLVVANGGDGTVHEVASGLRGSNLPLGILPGGTGNDVARNHGYPLEDLEAIINIFKNGKDRHVGALRLEAVPMPGENNYPTPTVNPKWNGEATKPGRIVRWIFLESDGGITSTISRAKLSRAKWIRGNIKYTYLGVTEILRWKQRFAWIKIDDKPGKVVDFTLFVFSMSEMFGGGYQVAPGASPINNHGYLCTGWGLGKIQMLLLMGPLRVGKHVGKWGITLEPCKKFEILTVDEEGEPCELSHDPPVTINVDGEPCLQTPAILEFYPKQLWIRGAQEVSWDKV